MVYIDNAHIKQGRNIPKQTPSNSAFGFHSLKTIALLNIVYHSIYLT